MNLGYRHLVASTCLAALSVGCWESEDKSKSFKSGQAATVATTGQAPAPTAHMPNAKASEPGAPFLTASERPPAGRIVQKSDGILPGFDQHVMGAVRRGITFTDASGKVVHYEGNVTDLIRDDNGRVIGVRKNTGPDQWGVPAAPGPGFDKSGGSAFRGQAETKKSQAAVKKAEEARRKASADAKKAAEAAEKGGR